MVVENKETEIVEFTLYEAVCLMLKVTPENLENLSDRTKNRLKVKYEEIKVFAASDKYKGHTNYHEVMDKLCEIYWDRYSQKEISKIFQFGGMYITKVASICCALG